MATFHRESPVLSALIVIPGAHILLDDNDQTAGVFRFPLFPLPITTSYIPSPSYLSACAPDQASKHLAEFFKTSD